MSHYDLETKCLHSGYTPKKGEPCALPIYQSTTFKYDTTDEMGQLFDLKAEGYFYTRLQNPTNDAVAAKIADLEGGVAGLLTSSGQAANFYAIFNICEAGDHVVAASTIYGGTFNLLGVTLKKLGIDCTFVDTDASVEEIAAAFKPNTKVLFAETIANPALVILDIEKFAKVAHEHEVPLIVDNTFATPINCRPLNGALISSHIQQLNIWTDTLFKLAVRSLTAETLTGTLMGTNIMVLLNLMNLTMVSFIQNNLERKLISQKLQHS